jgi:hypothetical protein
MRSTATTPTEYLETLPPDRREVIGKLRQVLLENLPEGFVETIEHGMLAYVVPHRLYPAGYHCDPQRPLPFIGLASQKQYLSLYHMGLYDGPLLTWFEAEWPKHTAAKLDLGKSCLRLKKPDQIPYALIGELAKKMTPAQWIRVYETARKNR